MPVPAKVFLKHENVKQRISPLYSPPTNELVEIFNRVVKEKIYEAETHGWSIMAYIDDFLDVYRVTPHKTMGISPHELLHGVKKKTELTKLYGDEPLPRDRIKLEVVNRRREKSKKWADRTRGAKRREFQSGKLVRVKLGSNGWSDP